MFWFKNSQNMLCSSSEALKRYLFWFRYSQKILFSGSDILRRYHFWFRYSQKILFSGTGVLRKCLFWFKNSRKILCSVWNFMYNTVPVFWNIASSKVFYVDHKYSSHGYLVNMQSLPGSKKNSYSLVYNRNKSWMLMINS